jgi:hypothetical protein
MSKHKKVDQEYLENIHEQFRASNEARSLFETIIGTPTERREDILRTIPVLIKRAGLAYALLALYRQQVDSGYILSDPLKTERKKEKLFIDKDTSVTFHVQWNPDREIRKVHELLIERGVMAGCVDKTKLINKDKKGKACYLCKLNIDIQNPGEILLAMDLAGDRYFVGANFAPITNNHFTIISKEHRPQQYRKNIIKALNDIVDNTDGYFRAIFNGLAGASIEEHEHLQVTSEQFPIEAIRIESRDVLSEENGIRVSRPKYYIPVWVIEGVDKAKTADQTDRIIRKWHSIDERNHTENIIASKSRNQYRTLIVFRDNRKLAGKGKSGAMGAFETGGNIVLSCDPKERETFDGADLETVKRLLKEVSPGRELTEI